MKQLLFICMSLLLFVGGVQAQQSKAVITAEKTMYDFGEIKEQGGVVTCKFVIKNTGESPLVITRIISPCGCTTTEWTKEPIAPGKTGTITVSYNPLHRPGHFTKVLSVYSNGKNGSYALTIKGVVK